MTNLPIQFPKSGSSLNRAGQIVNELQISQLRQKTLEAIHESAVDSIITINERGMIETVNPATERLFGYSTDELIGQNVSMLMPPPYKDEHDAYLQNYQKTRKPKIIGVGREVVAKKKDGTVFPMHLAVSEVQLADRCVYAGFIRDLSDLKQVEEQRATLGRIIEESRNEVYLFDAETLKFVQANRGGRENLGYTLAELQDLTPVDLKPDFTEEEFRNLIQPLLAGQIEKLDFGTRHQRKNGTFYDVDVHLQVSTYHSRPVFVAIILDVTERRSAEMLFLQQQQNMKDELERLVESRTEDLRKAQEELVLSEKFSTLGKVAGGIAHEIRNPLNAVKTSAYYLLHAKSASPDKVREHLERIDRQVTMIDSVVTALADVAKLPDADVRPVQMESLLREVVASTNLPPNVEVEFQFPDDLPNILADEQQIAIAFRNLVRNARDAMPDGGTMKIGAVIESDTVIFSVADSGIGISEQLIDNILEPLFTTKARGMGLGLSITLAIVEKNQGQLSFTSRPGQGATFSVTLKRSI